ncbi:MAG: phage portal protein [Chloroflexota bacterium]|nr:phage portal protein [Chloroflexota bacterium]
MLKQYVVTSAPGAMQVKSVSLDGLADAAWTPVIGGTDAPRERLLDLYEVTPWLYRAVNARADAIASLPVVWTDAAGTPLTAPPRLPFALDLPYLLNMIEGWLVLYGAAYLFKATNAARRVKLLRPLHPASVTPQYDGQRGLIGYERSVGGERVTLGVDEVVQIALPARRAELGHDTPPARAALMAAGMLRAADTFGDQYFQHGAMMPTLITVEGMPPAQEMEKLQSWAQRAMGGVRNAFRALALRANVSVQPLSGNVELGKLALPELTDKKREDIATALGVPHSLLFSSAANYATARQDDLHFYDKTILPQARRIESALNAQVFAPLGVRLRFAPERLELYQELEAQKADKLAVLVNAGILTREEARAELGVSQ